MSRLSLLFPLCLSLILVSGCSSPSSEKNPKFSGGSPQIVASPDSVSALLAESADRASSALETLAAVESARTPSANISPIGDVPAELRRTITVNWVGPIEPITKTLADRAGYGFLELGNKPSIPVVVSIDAENMRVVDVLRDIGLQLGVRGDVKVDANTKMIEIYYSPNAGVGG
ncbi:MAG: DotD/TraH family lipoprotein [Alphaproteobacteria bacterium]|nr:DotD/TraH family lipoprotein [Alphaproteobacteria bacterium]